MLQQHAGVQGVCIHMLQSDGLGEVTLFYQSVLISTLNNGHDVWVLS